MTMKAAFNGLCRGCDMFRPRCVVVYMRVHGKATQYQKDSLILCEDCRKRSHGKYRLDAKHR